MQTHFSIEVINQLLKDELSATETYQQALDTFSGDVGLDTVKLLLPILEDHQLAASSLQAEIRLLGEMPAESSGAWGNWTKVVQSGANFLGKKASLSSLHKGEETGTEDYQNALLNHKLPFAIRSLIESRILPAQQSHLHTLNRLLHN